MERLVAAIHGLQCSSRSFSCRSVDCTLTSISPSILKLVNAADWLDEQDRSDCHHLLPAGLFRGEPVVLGTGSCLGAELSSDVQILLVAHGTRRCGGLDHHVFHRLGCVRLDRHRHSHRLHLHATSTRFPSSVVGIDLSGSDLSSGAKVSSPARSTQGAREVLAATDAPAGLQPTFINSSDRFRQRHEEGRPFHHRTRQNGSNRNRTERRLLARVPLLGLVDRQHEDQSLRGHDHGADHSRRCRAAHPTVRTRWSPAEHDHSRLLR